jgi:hypothetical protein
MIRVNFPGIHEMLTFDGEVLEAFYGDKSQRVHIIHIQGIQVNTDRKGSRDLRINTVVGAIPYIPFEQELLPKVNELVAEVPKAMSSYKS